MKKDIIFILDVDLKSEVERFNSTRVRPYKFSIKSWEKWASTNNCELFVLNDVVVPHTDMGICWQRYYLFDILKNNDVNYNQILMVDADTIVHPDCPNFFNMTNNQLTGVAFDGSYEWILRSIEVYNKHMFGDLKFNFWEYIDCGFIVVNQLHESLFAKFVDLYWRHKNEFLELQKFGLGTDQTPFNLFREIKKHPINLLPYEFNMVDLHRKEVLNDQLTFTKMGHIYQFNAIPNNKNNEATYYWMEKTYEHLYGKYV